jgi:hypothetical protein
MAATPSSNLGIQNFFSATLTADITASSTDIFLDAIPNASEGFLVIEPTSTTKREVIFYNSKTALKVVCPSAADGRGQDDTSATTHTTGASVIMAPIAGFWEALQSGVSMSSGFRAGWFGVSNEGAFAYASATTITVPSSVANMLTIGSKMSFDQTTTKYFYVVGVSGTTITLTGGSDYTVANAAITNVYISNALSPKDFPQEFNYTPVLSADGGTPVIGNGTYAAMFHMVGRMVYVNFKTTLGTTTNFGTGGIQWTTPTTIDTDISQRVMGTGYIFDVSAPADYMCVVLTSGTTKFFTRCHTAGTGTFTNVSGSGGVPFSFATGDSISANFWYYI